MCMHDVLFECDHLLSIAQPVKTKDKIMLCVLALFQLLPGRHQDNCLGCLRTVRYFS